LLRYFRPPFPAVDPLSLHPSLGRIPLHHGPWLPNKTPWPFVSRCRTPSMDGRPLLRLHITSHETGSGTGDFSVLVPSLRRLRATVRQHKTRRSPDTLFLVFHVLFILHGLMALGTNRMYTGFVDFDSSASRALATGRRTFSVADFSPAVPLAHPSAGSWLRQVSRPDTTILSLLFPDVRLFTDTSSPPWSHPISRAKPFRRSSCRCFSGLQNPMRLELRSHAEA